MSRPKRTRYNTSSGYRPTNCYGHGDLPAPWAEGDVARLVGERHDRLDDLTGDQFIVIAAFSIDEYDSWYFRVADRQGKVSDRLHILAANPGLPEVDWMACFELVDTADPDGFMQREIMLRPSYLRIPLQK